MHPRPNNRACPVPQHRTLPLPIHLLHKAHSTAFSNFLVQPLPEPLQPHLKALSKVLNFSIPPCSLCVSRKPLLPRLLSVQNAEAILKQPFRSPHPNATCGPSEVRALCLPAEPSTSRSTGHSLCAWLGFGAEEACVKKLGRRSRERRCTPAT